MKKKFILHGKYTLNELEDIFFGEALDIVDTSKYIPWIEPENIIGIDYEKEKEKALKALNDYSINSGNKEIPIDWDMSYYVIDEYCTKNEFQGTLNTISDDLVGIFKNAIFIAKNLYSFSPSGHIFWCKKLVTKENVSELLEIAKKADKEADNNERLFLYYLFVEFFDAVYCDDYIQPQDDECIGIEFLSNENQIFLRKVRKFVFDKDMETLKHNHEEHLKNKNG